MILNWFSENTKTLAFLNACGLIGVISRGGVRLAMNVIADHHRCNYNKPILYLSSVETIVITQQAQR